MTFETLLATLSSIPDTLEFPAVIALIDSRYDFTPTAFRNGETHNAAGQNNGSCKLFSFARMQGFSETQTLACFGRFYREDVLQHPDATDHQNIRNFMRSGWGGIAFEGDALVAKPGH